MTKVMKKLSALLLAFALMLTMMPLTALEANAEDDMAFDIAINGSVIASVSKSRLATGQEDPQIFPFPAGQGKKWQYAVAQGVSIEGILTETLDVESLSDLADGSIPNLSH